MENIHKVVLIDDDPLNNIICEAVIHHKLPKAEVETYEESKAALSKLMEQNNEHPEELPEIIFLDINIPLMDGWEFLEDFEKKFPEHKKEPLIFMLTSSVSNADKEKSKNYKVVKDFISKPLTDEILNKILKKY